MALILMLLNLNRARTADASVSRTAHEMEGGTL